MRAFLRGLACVFLNHVVPLSPTARADLANDVAGFTSAGIPVLFQRRRCARCGASVFVGVA